MNDLKFTRTHEWLKEEQNEVTVGITQHAQELLGDLVFVELPEIGDEVAAGKELGVVESVKAASDFYAPISGKVIDINNEVIENPALVNSHPHTLGWLVKIKPSHPDEIKALLNNDQYQQEITKGH